MPLLVSVSGGNAGSLNYAWMPIQTHIVTHQEAWNEKVEEPLMPLFIVVSSPPGLKQNCKVNGYTACVQAAFAALGKCSITTWQLTWMYCQTHLHLHLKQDLHHGNQ